MAPFGIGCNLILTVATLCSIFDPKRSICTLCLCISHLGCLIIAGSQSNHVIVAMTVDLALLFSYSKDRTIWMRKTTASMYCITAALYLLPGFHKLNSDWFDPSSSCASLFASGFFAMFNSIPETETISKSIVHKIIQSAPYPALFIEFFLAALVFLLHLSTSAAIKRASLRLFFFVGSFFHLIICLPLPPMSVYPFSMLMVPMFALLLPPESIPLLQFLLSDFKVVAAAVGIASAALSISIRMFLQDEPIPLEYPPYGLWHAAVVWNLLAWAAIVYSILRATIAPSSLRPIGPHLTPLNALLTLAFVFIGLCPYLGIRNYPALAMFSNLRAQSEGAHSNHIVMGRHLSLFTSHYESNVQPFVTIHQTNLSSLLYYQVNLANYFASHIKKFNIAHGVRNEFWITPPEWTPTEVDLTSSFLEFSIPLIEFRKRISKASRSNVFRVEYSLSRGNETTRRLFIWPQEDGAISDWDAGLVAPVSEYDLAFSRFRSFDVTYSPCRH